MVVVFHLNDSRILSWRSALKKHGKFPLFALFALYVGHFDHCVYTSSKIFQVFTQGSGATTWGWHWWRTERWWSSKHQRNPSKARCNDWRGSWMQLYINLLMTSLIIEPMTSQIITQWCGSNIIFLAKLLLFILFSIL